MILVSTHRLCGTNALLPVESTTKLALQGHA